MRDSRRQGLTDCSTDLENGRLVSLDVLRGFAMFWVVLANTVREPARFMAHDGTVNSLAISLGHREWEGFSVADLFFPLFVFIGGIATVLSVGRLIRGQGRAAAHKRLFRRFVLLYLLGVFYDGGLTNPWPDIHLVGVLQRLAVCFLIAGLLVCHLRLRGLIIVCVALLAGYWAWLTFVPVPGRGVPSFGRGANWAWYVDKYYLVGRKCHGDWDSEGILSTVPAVASCLLGVFAGQFISNKSIADKRKLLYLLSAGLISVVLGYLWGLQFPLIKNLWTSSFVLVAGGYSLIVLGFFYLVVDIWRVRRSMAPFIWLGSNALGTYLVINLVDFRDIARRFVGGDVRVGLGRYGDAGVTAVSIALVVLLVRFLYRRRIFLRV